LIPCGVLPIVVVTVLVKIEKKRLPARRQ